MSTQISIPEVSKAILNGLIKAESDYRSWSGEEWLCWAPEYLLTVYAAKEISKIKKNKFITLENSTKTALEDAGSRGKGKLHSDIRANGRVDILLWWANGTPRGVIEMKNNVYSYSKIKDDAKRICKMLKRKTNKSTLQFGIISFYISGIYEKRNPETMIEQQINKLKRSVVEDSAKLCTITLECTKIIEDENSAWCCVNFIFKPIK